jgi:glyoxylase-like metal-dependent hydrolase (beta-lactamase superfamily II)
MTPDIRTYHDPASGTLTYLVMVPGGRHCAVIDPVLDFEPGTGRTSTRSAERVIADVRQRELTCDWILETHLHDDHLTAAPFLRGQIGGQIAAGKGMVGAARPYEKLFPACANSVQVGRAFDHLFEDGERFQIGALPADVLFTPGHCPAGVAYGVADRVFVGDVILTPDRGTGRTDLPGGDAAALYRAVRRILSLPEETWICPGHSFAAANRPSAWKTTIATQRAENALLREGADEAAFVAKRRLADEALPAPRCLLTSVQVNLRAGQLPEPNENGYRGLRLPLNAL